MNDDLVPKIIGWLLLIPVAFFFWQCDREINYGAAYQDMVKKTSTETVKQECLK